MNRLATPVNISPHIKVTLLAWINRGLEVLWLLAVVLVPLAFFGRTQEESLFASSEAVIAYVEVPKIALLRTLVGLMAILWLIEWGIQDRLTTDWLAGPWRPRLAPSRWLSSLSSWLRGHPARWLVLAVWFYLGTTLLSTALSASFNVSAWGEIPGQDGNAAYTIIAYVLLFGVVATHLKTHAQIWRLLGAVVIVGVLIAGYGVMQHYGHDLFNLSDPTGGGRDRVTVTMGNAIFAASVMLLTIPITMAVATAALREPIQNGVEGWRRLKIWALPLTAAVLGALALGVQIMGLTFTFSRGSWLGTIMALVIFLVLVAMFIGWRTFSRSALLIGLIAAIGAAVLHWQGSISILGQGAWIGAILVLASLVALIAVLSGRKYVGRIILGFGLAAALAAAVVLAPSSFTGDVVQSKTDPEQPIAASSSTATEVVARLTSVRGQVFSGVFGGRVETWTASWRLIKDRPWFQFDDLNLLWLRPLIGYGPDLFRFTNLLESRPSGNGNLPLEPDHAHNLFINQTVEQGALGLLSSLGLFVAFFAGGGYLLIRERGRYSPAQKLILIGLLAMVAGRFVEQQVGLARVSDLTVFWVLLAVFVALPRVVAIPEEAPVATPRPLRESRRRRTAAPSPKSGFGWRQLLHLAIVVWLIGGIGVLSWVKSVNYARAAVAVGDGIEVFSQGDFQGAMDYLDRAISRAPDVPVYYNYRANVYLAYLVNQVVPKEHGCSQQAEIPYEVCLQSNYFHDNLEAVERSPLYFRSRLSLGNAAFNLSQYPEAVQFYKDTLDLVPASWPIRNVLAESYLAAGQPEAALQTLQESLTITGDTGFSTRSTYLQGVAYQDLGELEKSVQSIERSLALGLSSGETQEAHRILEEVYASLGQQLSVEYYEESIRRNPGDAAAYYYRGRKYEEQGLIKEALDSYRTAARHDRGYGEAYRSAANISLDLSDYPEAAATYDQAIRHGVRDADIYSMRGRAYLGLGQYDEAISDFTDAISLDPQNVIAYNGRGEAYLELGQLDLARQDLDQAILADPRNAKALNNRGKVYALMGLLDQGIAEFSKAIQEDPQLILAYINRGQAYARMGQPAVAIRDFTVVLLREPENTVAMFNKGEALSALERYEEASRYFREINKYQDIIPVYLKLGEVYLKLGRYDLAVENFDKAVYTYRQSAVLYNNRGEIYAQLGQLELAVQDFNQAILLDPQIAAVFTNRGDALAALGEINQANRDYDEANRLRQSNSGR